MAAIVDSQVIRKIHEKERQITKEADPVADGPTAAARKHVGETLDGHVISEITAGEKQITDGERLKGGPTSTAQSILTKSFVKSVSSDSDTINTNSDRKLSEQSDNISRNVERKPDINSSSVNMLTQAVEKATTHFKKEVAYQIELFEKTVHQQITQMGPKDFAIHPKLDSNTISVILAAEKEITGKKMPVKDGPTAQAQKHTGESIFRDNIQAVSQGEKLISITGEVTKDGPTAFLEQKLNEYHMNEAH